MKTILFQGDSITDCGRNRENSASLGMGYPVMVAGELGRKFPGEYCFLNRGIGGNRSIDVYARIGVHLINLKPDILSLHIGVNDSWAEFSSKNGASAEKYERNCRMLLDETLEALPDLKILLLGPFTTPGTLHKTLGEDFAIDVRRHAEAMRRIADDYRLPFVDLQATFDEACEKAPASYWTAEGVHPTAAGHGIIAAEWLKAFETL